MTGCATIPTPEPVASGRTTLMERIRSLECRVTALEKGQSPSVCAAPVTTLPPTTTRPPTTLPQTTTTSPATTTTTQPPVTTTNPPVVTTTVPTPVGGSMPAIRRSGNTITRGGQTWWFTGYNSFVWSANCGNDDEEMTAAEVDAWFASMRHDGHGAVRLFFYAGWNLARLDAALASAKRHNVYLTITLDDAIGGCGENDKDPAWFANPAETATYERHMRLLLERYKGEPAIAWFEFFNEPGGDNTVTQLRAFYDRMGVIADTVDPNRLWASGVVAPYWVDGEANYRRLHESPGVDIASLHEYDQREVESNHGDNARANSAGKPVIVGEFGIYSRTDGSGCETSFTERARRFAAKLGVYTNTSTGYVGAFAWAWQPGNGGGSCEYGNLDADLPTQAVLRGHNR